MSTTGHQHVLMSSHQIMHTKKK